MSLKQVLVLRKDLGMNKGKMIAQGAHAAMMCLIYAEDQTAEHMEAIEEWALGNMAKIAVGVADGTELDDIIRKAKEAGLLVYEVIDSGKTVPACANVKTCAAIGPGPEEEIDKITGLLKLL